MVTDTGVGQGPPPALDVKKESSSSISLASFFEVVADDLQILNQNLQSVSTPLGNSNVVLFLKIECYLQQNDFVCFFLNYCF